jgi:DNA helicase-2/ATP-dependent DNA helicase PcrA
VRDVLAYLRLIAKPFDDVACARILAMPAWQMQPEDLLRLAERAKRERRPIYDILQSPQGELAFDASHGSTDELLAFLLAQRKTLRRRGAREILAELTEWLEIAQRASERDRRTVGRLAEFAKEWEPKSERRDLSEFLEYLDYYEQAGEKICLEDDAPGDAVQLMSAHGAKGLEFPHVFLLQVNSRSFPPSKRSPLFEFPTALMKEELPDGDFHIQEERRLFYVAITRAEERLTITTIREKKDKVPVFIEDIVMDPAIKRRDVRQLSPKVAAAAQDPRDGMSLAGTDELFPAVSGPARIFSRIGQWAESYQTVIPEPLKLSPSSVEAYRKCPAQYLFEKLWSLDGAPKATLTFGRVMHQTIKRFLGELRKGNRIGFDEVKRLFDTEWSERGFEDEYQQDEYRKDGVEQLRAFHAAMLEATPEILEQEKAFELPMANNVIIGGRFDQVNSLNGPRGKDVEIVDYKTGRPLSDANARKNLQLSIYALAAKEIFEWNPVRLAFHYLQNNQLQVTTREKKDFDDAERKVQEAAADIRAGEFGAKSGFICKSCAYRMICPEHESHI